MDHTQRARSLSLARPTDAASEALEKLAGPAD
jgi:hypothetical protein